MKNANGRLFGITGSVLFPILTLFSHWLLAPTMLNDGQYAIVLFSICPIGAALAGFTGWGIEAQQKGDTGRARNIFQGAGALIAFFLIYILYSEISQSHYEKVVMLSMFPIVIACLWAVLMTIYGFGLKDD